MKRKTALERNLPILGVFRSFAAVGVDPAVMGIGPAVAIPAAIKAAGLEINDIDLFEINEVMSLLSYNSSMMRSAVSHKYVNIGLKLRRRM